MAKLIHPIAGLVALLTIMIFWSATAISELFGSHAAVTMVKTAIPWGFLLLIPALAAAAGSGFSLARGRRRGLIGAKRKRMPFIGANGAFVLVPAALFLAYKANASDFDAVFWTVQALELIVGAVNIALLSLNMHDGMALTKRRRMARPA